MPLSRTPQMLRQFVIFACIGAAGFVVDSAVLMMMIEFAHTGLYVSRIASFLCAATFTWAANRHLNFADARQSPAAAQWLRFMGLNALGGAINFMVYALLVAQLASVARHPVIGVAAGSLAGLLVNFVLSRSLVFRAHSKSRPTRTT